MNYPLSAPSPKVLFPPTNKIKYSKKTNNHPHPFPQLFFFKIQKHPPAKPRTLNPKLYLYIEYLVCNYVVATLHPLRLYLKKRPANF
jgi:hypothetical protein